MAIGPQAPLEQTYIVSVNGPQGMLYQQRYNVPILEDYATCDDAALQIGMQYIGAFYVERMNHRAKTIGQRMADWLKSMQDQGTA